MGTLKIILAGRFAVEVGGRPVDDAGLGNLGRLALAYLVLERDRPVSRHELAEVLWGDELPATWEAALRGVVSRVRALLATAGGGVDAAFGCYQARLPEDAGVDVEQAAAAVERAEARATSDPAPARQSASEAAATCALQFLPGASGHWVERRHEALVELRARALEALATAAQAGGDPGAAVAAAEQAVALHPLRESAHLRLMEAHLAAGNRASALRAYERCRRVLAEELGVAPSPHVEAAYQRALEAGEAGEAPPPALTTNLPAALTSFVGRERELAEVGRLLAGTRLLTLTGPGGVGKSRLALEAVSSLAPGDAGGAWLVELAGLTDPGLVPQQVLSALGMGEAPGSAPLESLARHIGGRRMVVVLDNCEHLAAACADLADRLLRACRGLRILATSREPLGAVSETCWVVPPLSTEGEGPEAEAVRLFLDRAAAAAPGLPLGPDVAGDAAVICRRLDGIPLAIELAAARARALSVPEICRRLDDRFALLVGGPRTAPPRHQTLRATIDWTYDALPAGQRRLFAWLSSFAGGFTLEAAEAVYDDHHAVLDGLAALVDQSLVIADRSGPTTRYRLLETLRQYGHDRLTERGEQAAARDRNLAWAVTLAGTAAAGIDGTEQARWFDVLDTEHDNIRAALEWAGSTAAAGELIASLARFWQVRGHFSEARSRMEAWLEAGAGPPRLRARVLGAAAVVAQLQADLAAARTWYEEELVVTQALEDRAAMAVALHGLGNIAVLEGDFATALGRFEDNLAVARDMGDRRLEAASLMNVGVVHQYRFMRRDAPVEESAPKAQAAYRESLSLYTALGDRHGMAMALENLGTLAPYEGDRATSWSCHTESLRLRREVGDKLGIATSTRFLAGLAFWDGDLDAARSLNEESLSIHRQLGNRPRVAEALLALADCARTEGAFGEARRLLEESVALHREMGAGGHLARSLCILGEAEIADRDFQAARRSLEESRQLAEKVGNWLGTAWALTYLASVARAEDDWARAAALVVETLGYLRETQYNPALLAVLGEVAAGLAIHRRQYEPAAVLHGAVDALRHPPGSERVERPGSIDDDLDADALTGTLGLERTAALQAEGRSLLPSDVVAAIRAAVEGYA